MRETFKNRKSFDSSARQHPAKTTASFCFLLFAVRCALIGIQFHFVSWQKITRKFRVVMCERIKFYYDERKLHHHTSPTCRMSLTTSVSLTAGEKTMRNAMSLWICSKIGWICEMWKSQKNLLMFAISVFFSSAHCTGQSISFPLQDFPIFAMPSEHFSFFLNISVFIVDEGTKAIKIPASVNICTFFALNRFYVTTSSCTFRCSQKADVKLCNLPQNELESSAVWSELILPLFIQNSEFHLK